MKCQHQFDIKDLELTGIPEPVEPPKEDYFGWLDYYKNYKNSDAHLKRVKWACTKCKRNFMPIVG
jgi:hypothetical protein